MPDFQPARLPSNETARLASVRRTGLMDSQNKSRFDIYTKLFRHIARVPVSYTGLLDESRQYFLSENFTGCLLGAKQVDRPNTLCQHALLDTRPFIVEDMREHPTFMAHPLITGDPYWVFWAGFPIVTKEGYVLGTICAVDFRPNSLSEEQIELLTGVTEDLALTIQLQADQQELVAEKMLEVANVLKQHGAKSLQACNDFLNLCMSETVPHVHAELLDIDLAEQGPEGFTLSAKGRDIKTGKGLGPAAYKRRASLLKEPNQLDDLLQMMEF